MKPIDTILEQHVSAALARAVGEPGSNPAAIIKLSQNPKFGDYQANGVMGLAKQLKTNPRQLAQKVLDHLDVLDMCEKPEVAGCGFINFRLKGAWLAERLGKAIKDTNRLGIDAIDNPPTTVIDFSGPNIAKEMHVGHLRSTIIGDTLARILEFAYGDEQTSDGAPHKKIIRQNHVGDWGLQMGMIIYAVEQEYLEKQVQPYGPNDKLRGVVPLSDINPKLEELENIYKDISDKIADGDVRTEQECREYTYKLQNGDKDIYAFWKKACEITLKACFDIYDKLNVKLGPHDVCGESFYRDKLPEVIAKLEKANLLQESDGAQCVFLDGFKAKDGTDLPLIVRKSDGAYLYATTDLAAIRYRVKELNAKRIIYVTDARQKLHFQMVFACARKAGWAPENAPDPISLEHVPFGSVLGPDNKPFKTRSGENIKLKDLLAEAVSRARGVVEEKNPGLPEEQKGEIARVVGIGAVKYADLSNNLVSDYVFDWDKMLAMEGNTAPYMQYAYARICSIFRKGAIDADSLFANNYSILLEHPDELALAKLLLRYAEIIAAVARDLRPHLLTSYLFDLAQGFSSFYTNCPVLKADTSLRNSRLLLCHQTAQTIRHGLQLLGIDTIEQM